MKQFKYVKPSFNDIEEVSNRTSSYDSIFKKGFKQLKVKDKQHTIRILPPTWDSNSTLILGNEKRHYGIFVPCHNYNKTPYICSKQALGKHCVFCDERQKAYDENNEKLAGELYVGTRLALWVIDRENENEGPQLWAMPKKVFSELAIRSIDSKTREVICYIDDPEEGYDVSFTRTPKTEKKPNDYIGVDISRRSTPLGGQGKEWLDYIMQHPIPDVLQIYDEDYLKQVFSGSNTEFDADKIETEIKNTQTVNSNIDNTQTKLSCDKFDIKSYIPKTYSDLVALSDDICGKILIEFGATEEEVKGLSKEEKKTMIQEALGLHKPVITMPVEKPKEMTLSERLKAKGFNTQD